MGEDGVGLLQPGKGILRLRHAKLTRGFGVGHAEINVGTQRLMGAELSRRLAGLDDPKGPAPTQRFQVGDKRNGIPDRDARSLAVTGTLGGLLNEELLRQQPAPEVRFSSCEGIRPVDPYTRR